MSSVPQTIHEEGICEVCGQVILRYGMRYQLGDTPYRMWDHWRHSVDRSPACCLCPCHRVVQPELIACPYCVAHGESGE